MFFLSSAQAHLAISCQAFHSPTKNLAGPYHLTGCVQFVLVQHRSFNLFFNYGLRMRPLHVGVLMRDWSHGGVGVRPVRLSYYQYQYYQSSTTVITSAANTTTSAAGLLLLLLVGPARSQYYQYCCCCQVVVVVLFYILRQSQWLVSLQLSKYYTIFSQ